MTTPIGSGGIGSAPIVLDLSGTGTGVIDRTQTIVITLDASGARTETLSDTDGQGQLTDATVTTTSADRTLVTITRDLTGGGVVNQTETRQTNADGSVVDTLTDVSADGKVIDRTVTTASADGLGKLTEIDSTGRVDANGAGATTTTTFNGGRPVGRRRDHGLGRGRRAATAGLGDRRARMTARAAPRSGGETVIVTASSRAP